MINNNVLKCARVLVRAGVSVIPIRPVEYFPSQKEGAAPGEMENDGGKKPALSTWGEYQRRLPTEEEIEKWFQTDQIRGIAVISGVVSKNLEVLDFDQPEAFDQWMALCESHGLADIAMACPVSETPSGCRHLYFRCEAPAGKRLLLAQKDRGDGKPTVVIEDRGEGNYSVVAPSPREVHPANKGYRMLRGRPDMLPMITEEQREGFRSMARLLNTWEPVARAEAPRRRAEVVNTGDTDLPGEDYNSRPDAEEKMAQILERHGWRCTARNQTRSDWLRPGHPSRYGRSATLGYGRDGVFYVFTTDAHPFEMETAYGPFQLYTLLEHGGDFRSAASALALQGYGRQDAAPPRALASRNGVHPPTGVYTPNCLHSSNGVHPAAEAGQGLPIAAPVEWPAMTPVGEAKLPKFPIEAIPGAVQSMIVEVARVGQVSIDMAAVAAIQTVSAATRGRVRIKVGQVFDVHSNMYGVVVAEPSEHKSYVLKQMLDPLRKLEDRIQIDAAPRIEREQAIWENIENRILGLRSQLRSPKLSQEMREDKEKEIEELVAERKPVPAYPQVLADDVNPTALAMIMGQQEDNSIAVFSDEGGFFDSLVQDRKNDFDFILKAANQERTSVNRVGRGFSKIHKPALTLLLMVQPIVVSQIAANPAFRGKGLLSRFIYTYPPSSAFAPFDENASISPRITADYADVISALFHIPNPLTAEDTTRCHEIMIAPGSEGMALWKKFNDQIKQSAKDDDGELRTIADWAGKLPGQVARLAGIFHLLRYPNIHTAISVPIEADSVNRAVKIGRYLIPHALKTFADPAAAEALKHAIRLLKNLQARPAAPSVAFHDICAVLRGAAIEEIEYACGVLADHGYLRPMGSGAKGAPARVDYYLNPAMYQQEGP